MAGNSQRAAWNKAMGLRTQTNSNMSKKRLRREKKSSLTQHTDHGSSSNPQNMMEYPQILRLDRLERGGQVNFAPEDEDDDDDGIGFYSGTSIKKKKNKGDNEDDDEYDELEELEAKSRGGKRKSKINKEQQEKKKKLKTTKDSKKKMITMPKWMKIRTLSSILIEESTRTEDGILKQYLEAEARPTEMNDMIYPIRKFCPVTGLIGMYKDPKSGLPFATIGALEQIQERIPPWFSGSGGGSTLYHETIHSLRNATLSKLQASVD